jgi:hypothetical protein
LQYQGKDPDMGKHMVNSVKLNPERVAKRKQLEIAERLMTAEQIAERIIKHRGLGRR